jgi:hypothetical protein
MAMLPQRLAKSQLKVAFSNKMACRSRRALASNYGCTSLDVTSLPTMLILAFMQFRYTSKREHAYIGKQG